MENLFEPSIEYPDPLSAERFNSLVGLETIKDNVVKEAKILLNPELLEDWSKKHYKKHIVLIDHFKDRAPFFIFAGDVGTGKTSLAETFGNVVAQDEKLPVTLYKLSLKSRGHGAVGQMTQLISDAFDGIVKIAKQFWSGKDKKPSSAVIFLIDEADALAQSRELQQMHHEDKAGVNALIRGIDTITNQKLPVVIIMCTNRIDSIDPAVRRRAASIYTFARPNTEQRHSTISKALGGTNLTEEQINQIVVMTGETKELSYGFTYSDLRQRLLPQILLESFPDSPIEYELILDILNRVKPTPPFNEEIS